MATSKGAIGRRGVLGGIGAALALPSVARAAPAKLLKFIPQADLAVIDPIWTTAYVTRNHGMLVFDQLYGTDSAQAPQPQMVAGHTTEDDGRTWTMTLREGLRFHDGTPVLARDCVASVQRWGKRDGFGQTVLAYTDEISAPDDRTLKFRMKRAFPLLPTALGKPGSNICAIMPERLAKTDPFTQVTEMVGSGPFRFKTSERVPGSLVVYERFAGYQPREGAASFTAGAKQVHYDRIEWHVIPDASTAAGALQTGEVDWWESPTVDLAPMLTGAEGVVFTVQDKLGFMMCMRPNELHPPFDNPAIRRAILLALSQDDYCAAVAGDDPKLRHVPAGFFTPGTPMASDAGMAVLTKPRDIAGAKAAILAAGYKGEKVVLMAPTDLPVLKALADVTADLLAKIGLNVDYQAMDWGSVVQRRAKKDPVAKGGWSVFCTTWSGLDQANPAVHNFLRGQGEAGIMGWPSAPKIEALRTEWIESTDAARRKQIAEQLQAQAFEDLPYLPLGQAFGPTAFRSSITGILEGFPMFWNVRPA
jgi:peptide/nickel transport system substrate-binding protein